MMRQSYDKLDFQKVLKTVSSWVHSDVSKEYLFSLMPLDNIEDIRLRSEQINEIRRMRQDGIFVNLESFLDLRDFIKKVTPLGSMLDAIELYCFIPFLNNTEEIIDKTEQCDKLKKITQSMSSQEDLLRQLQKSVNSEGEVLDTASQALKEIRKAIKNLEGKIRKRLEDIIQSEEVSIFLQDSFITQRSGRWVIPVRMDSKGQVSGVVHDVSKSGETAFIEPISIINLTNEMEALRADEKLEEVKIMKELSNRIRINADNLISNFHCLVYFDVLNALSIYADTLSMEPPIIHEKMEIRLFSARHPLLYSHFKSKGIENELVPLDLTLDCSRPIMVITGPNAGGKTVVLKTTGLLVIMALTGMHIPALSNSRIPFVRKIHADIGDEQSIEDSISTFAGHISNLKKFINEADKTSLVLIDELGTGTDPIEGAALASAILKALRNTGALVIANTHLSEIKGFVHRSEGMVNSAMEFDPKTFKPLYKLTIGLPGQSYAFETARRYGLPESVIDSARQLLGSQKIELDSLIKELQDKTIYYEKQAKELEKRLSELNNEQERLKKIIADTEQQRLEIIEKSYIDAQNLVDRIREELFSMLEEAKKLDKQLIKTSIKKATSISNDLSKSQKLLRPDAKPLLSIDDIKAGDKVYSKIVDDYVTVLSVNIKQKRLKISLRGIEFDVPVEDIKGLSDKQVSNIEGTVQICKQDDISVSTLNLVGKRVDEALSEVEPFLNHSFLSGMSEALIIHGIGTGALKKAIREYLKGHNLVRGCRDGSVSEGGTGVTVISFK